MYWRSEVSDTVNLMAGEESLAESGEVKPLEGGVFHSSIVEIEAIYVNVRYHYLSLNINRGHLAVTSALPPKQQGKYWIILYHFSARLSSHVTVFSDLIRGSACHCFLIALGIRTNSPNPLAGLLTSRRDKF